jgi:hypothetical protein
MGRKAYLELLPVVPEPVVEPEPVELGELGIVAEEPVGLLVSEFMLEPALPVPVVPLPPLEPVVEPLDPLEPLRLLDPLPEPLVSELPEVPEP